MFIIRLFSRHLIMTASWSEFALDAVVYWGR
jgi:hypothetical protein